MDTFSISLSLGAFNISKNKSIFYAITVAIFHFVLPFIGTVIGDKIITILNINAHLLLGIILLILSAEMIINIIKKDESNIPLSIINLLLLSISVSLDSFSTGIGLGAITTNYYMSCFIFSMSAFLFTLIGLLIGKYSSEKLGAYAQYLGTFLLIIMGIINIL